MKSNTGVMSRGAFSRVTMLKLAAVSEVVVEAPARPMRVSKGKALRKYSHSPVRLML